MELCGGSLGSGVWCGFVVEVYGVIMGVVVLFGWVSVVCMCGFGVILVVGCGGDFILRGVWWLGW